MAKIRARNLIKNTYLAFRVSLRNEQLQVPIVADLFSNIERKVVTHCFLFNSKQYTYWICLRKELTTNFETYFFLDLSLSQFLSYVPWWFLIVIQSNKEIEFKIQLLLRYPQERKKSESQKAWVMEEKHTLLVVLM